MSSRTVVVGAGIIGLAVARQILCDRPEEDVVVLEKEAAVATHQSGHNSGVIHAGVYYAPGTLKARLCQEGRALLGAFCEEHGVAIDHCGKVIVATKESELGPMRAIAERGRAAGLVDLREISGEELRELEPHAAGIAAIHSPSSAIVDFGAVARALADDVVRRGGAVHLGVCVSGFVRETSGVVVRTSTETFAAERVVVCAGLQSDRLAVAAGDEADPRIVSFRGEYYRLVPERTNLVRGLIYPIPDPRFPFLGVHATRRIDGNVDLGPNAVLAFAREGYAKGDVSFSAVKELARSAGFRTFARRNWRVGAYEVAGSLSRRVFLSRVRRYLPEVGNEDVVPGPAGVRAQAMEGDGTMVDDFRITKIGPITLVRNAPSPAATSSLAIARYVCAQMENEQ